MINYRWVKGTGPKTGSNSGVDLWTFIKFQDAPTQATTDWTAANEERYWERDLLPHAVFGQVNNGKSEDNKDLGAFVSSDAQGQYIKDDFTFGRNLSVNGTTIIDPASEDIPKKRAEKDENFALKLYRGLALMAKDKNKISWFDSSSEKSSLSYSQTPSVEVDFVSHTYTSFLNHASSDKNAAIATPGLLAQTSYTTDAYMNNGHITTFLTVADSIKMGQFEGGQVQLQVGGHIILDALNGSGTFVYVNTTSDRAAKKDIKPFKEEDALKIVIDTPVYSFKYKNDNAPSIGIMAQDLENYNIEDFNLVNGRNADGYLTIKENKLIYILWNAVKQQEKEINKLKEEISALKKTSN